MDSQLYYQSKPLRKHWNIQTFNNKLQTIPPIIYESNIYIYMHIYIKMYKIICYNINIIFYFRVIIGEPLTLDQPEKKLIKDCHYIEEKNLKTSK